ncbi:hypothetical protein LUW77_03140 [Streptomyces radiopugnans]|nr:hypothetical protein LUW77_03140 [Streptomyces radiopugnans]
MTRNDLASTPTEASPTVDMTLVETLATRLADQLATAIADRLSVGLSAAEVELMAYPPDKAARLLGKTENWVIEAIQDERIPYTRVGRSPRMTAAHIRQVLAEGERLPNKYAKPVRAAA